MMQNGVCWERIIAERPTSETESGSWPTPRANKVICTNQQALNRIQKTGYHGNLEEAVALRMWPTPQANEDAAGTPNGKMQKMLGNHPDIRGTTKEEWAGGTLNPPWVEWLMGWPVGWTDLKPLETDKFQSWQQQHGGF
jgi:hypothetical protein